MKTLVLKPLPANQDSSISKSQAHEIEKRMQQNGCLVRAIIRSSSHPEKNFEPGTIIWLKTAFGSETSDALKPTFSLAKSLGDQSPLFQFSLKEDASWADQTLIIPEPPIETIVENHS